MFDNIFSDTTSWFLEHGVKIALIIIAALVLQAFVRLSSKRLLKIFYKKAKGTRPEEEIDKRSSTLSTVIVKSSQVLLSVFVVITVLSEMAINISALVAGVGIAGLALGFGAQGLVKDVISGLFIIIEDQYGQGDIITVTKETGIVKELNLRRTIIEDQEGNIYHIPNKEITVVKVLQDWPKSENSK
ncbi:MAG: mechanosensitive ion channel domain-containing protein [bacterium]